MEYEWRAYCDICKLGSPWAFHKEEVVKWRHVHFKADHPQNPMKKQNCRIQRRIVDE